MKLQESAGTSSRSGGQRTTVNYVEYCITHVRELTAIYEPVVTAAAELDFTVNAWTSFNWAFDSSNQRDGDVKHVTKSSANIKGSQSVVGRYGTVSKTRIVMRQDIGKIPKPLVEVIEILGC